MKKTFRTLTSGFGNTDDVIRLRLDITSSKGFIKKGVEVKAIVDDQTGEVRLFVDPDMLR
ncbi:hypothetical protein RLK57_05195 [Streptococcus pseudopneumoniae]|jgi:hypothetical protein|uniref:Uncharacterized protein n=1 Tax=Streptococcus mitis TaxID=28037 RepID=A0A7G1ITW9_STRMT|nr:MULTISPECIES: hypothetical protein [Streptococcus]MDU4467725.1 hypothetical protein [Streptococcus mitis]MDN5027421.1 hypothetical protein [Streptococcus sp. SPS1]MDS9310930.1 hypothetical protein [Streptococcus pseudopneumoniae]NIB82078.1 hypothetical protein [Streptococcus pseudopneumoniae]PLV78824.1 hypothetical protein AZJ07_08470 [Streptococcus pseudopneumoniae]